VPVPARHDDVDPAEVARWLHLESERLRRAYEEAADWSERVFASGAGEDAKKCAQFLRDEAYRRWWFHTEEFAPVVMTWLERQVERRHFEERQRIQATLGWVRRPWQTGPEF
jgi:hypothetical protein